MYFSEFNKHGNILLISYGKARNVNYSKTKSCRSQLSDPRFTGIRHSDGNMTVAIETDQSAAAVKLFLGQHSPQPGLGSFNTSESSTQDPIRLSRSWVIS